MDDAVCGGWVESGLNPRVCRSEFVREVLSDTQHQALRQHVGPYSITPYNHPDRLKLANRIEQPPTITPSTVK
jgi:hypothetical protein